MKWPEIRSHYPEQWLLAEAIAAHREGNKRILAQIAVIESFPDSVQGLQHYGQLHHEIPGRELYVFHSRRASLDITERRWVGITKARG